MTVGNASPMIGMLLFLIAIIAAYGWRISVVVRHRGTLDAFVTSKALLILRRLGIFMMAVGLTGSLALLFVKTLTLALLGKPGDAGIGYYVVSLGLYVIGSAGMSGLGIFEMSRLFGFESKQRGETVQPA